MTGVSEDDAVRFSEYLDAEMSDAERAVFEAELRDDDALAAAFEEFRQTLDVLGGLAAPAPDHFAEGVKTRIRRRSRGRYFGRRSAYRERIQTEAFLAVALTVLVGAVMLASPSGFRALFESPELTLVDDGSGDALDDGPARRPAPDEHDPNDGTGSHEGLEADPDQTTAPYQPIPMDGSLARSGSVGADPVRPMVHHEYTYIVRSELDADQLDRRLREQFGRSGVRVDGERLLVAVPRAQVAATLERISDLGTIRRELHATEGARDALDIAFEPGQGRRP